LAAPDYWNGAVSFAGSSILRSLGPFRSPRLRGFRAARNHCASSRFAAKYGLIGSEPAFRSPGSFAFARFARVAHERNERNRRRLNERGAPRRSACRSVTDDAFGDTIVVIVLAGGYVTPLES
jgi:hypothetical protein